ncbi:MAG: CcoQ/FixQ family Cbb3-type cytochrome c oxidase assembly chaperone [Gammaproteobacteria bacterium]|nr:CcoQ/FixQ family Cbb3-type cytochrome c oxidase assembly chaperone [Gammaproteobacteria bacterium]NIR58770.1 CcoQ/FixQ family Cbb3-type cytochrome c oxidase assembly chaperone [Gammaproteobacteria bacterium]NIV73802.1 CcoQ/FixQ family Cbb3-type cytochrome c oxidase assembly chaperone [Gammaproteobacteria bacterium]
MEGDIVTFLRSLFTVLVVVCFVAVWVWAWSDRRKEAFREAAHLPFSEEDPAAQRKEGPR